MHGRTAEQPPRGAVPQNISIYAHVPKTENSALTGLAVQARARFWGKGRGS